MPLKNNKNAKNKTIKKNKNTTKRIITAIIIFTMLLSIVAPFLNAVYSKVVS